MSKSTRTLEVEVISQGTICVNCFPSVRSSNEGQLARNADSGRSAKSEFRPNVWRERSDRYEAKSIDGGPREFVFIICMKYPKHTLKLRVFFLEEKLHDFSSFSLCTDSSY